MTTRRDMATPPRAPLSINLANATQDEIRVAAQYLANYDEDAEHLAESLGIELEDRKTADQWVARLGLEQFTRHLVSPDALAWNVAARIQALRSAGHGELVDEILTLAPDVFLDGDERFVIALWNNRQVAVVRTGSGYVLAGAATAPPATAQSVLDRLGYDVECDLP